MRLVPVLSGAAAWSTTCARPHVLGTSMGCKYSQPSTRRIRQPLACLRCTRPWRLVCRLYAALRMLYAACATWHMAHGSSALPGAWRIARCAAIRRERRVRELPVRRARQQRRRPATALCGEARADPGGALPHGGGRGDQRDEYAGVQPCNKTTDNGRPRRATDNANVQQTTRYARHSHASLHDRTHIHGVRTLCAAEIVRNIPQRLAARLRVVSLCAYAGPRIYRVKAWGMFECVFSSFFSCFQRNASALRGGVRPL